MRLACPVELFACNNTNRSSSAANEPLAETAAVALSDTRKSHHQASDSPAASSPQQLRGIDGPTGVYQPVPGLATAVRQYRHPRLDSTAGLQHPPRSRSGVAAFLQTSVNRNRPREAGGTEREAAALGSQKRNRGEVSQEVSAAQQQPHRRIPPELQASKTQSEDSHRRDTQQPEQLSAGGGRQHPCRAPGPGSQRSVSHQSSQSG